MPDTAGPGADPAGHDDLVTWFDSAEEAGKRLAEAGYLADPATAAPSRTVSLLALRLR